MSGYQEIHGDLIQLALDGKFDVIAHGVNCFCRQKSGLAPQMVRAFDTDKFYWENPKYAGDINKLGVIDYSMIMVKDRQIWTGSTNAEGVRNLTVVNCYSQFNYGKNTEPNINYQALQLCFQKMNHVFAGKHIGLPLIGAGLAGGSWSIISKLIYAEFVDCQVTIVHYSPTLSA